MINITPENITSLKENEIFVFGSNYAGRHGKGAALLAMKKFGAKSGQGTGFMGNCYGIATKDSKLKVLPLNRIEWQIHTFLEFANENQHLHFLVTKIGCGLAGYKPKDIAPLFFKYDIPSNISLPECFLKYKEK